jgi:hypothetical protein
MLPVRTLVFLYEGRRYMRDSVQLGRLICSQLGLIDLGELQRVVSANIE